MANTFLRLTPMLWTTALDETVQFYTEKLGIVCGEKNDDWGWAALHRGELEIMLSKPNAHAAFDKPNFTGSFYMEVTDVDALWQELKDSVSVCYPIEDFEWGMREFAIYDNNGYLLQFGQEMTKND